MAKYYYDCEFLEGTQTKRILGIPYGKTKPTIDLISIGIVAENGRELYLISKDFNLREAWDRHDIKVKYRSGDARNHLGDTYLVKDYWIRENVLMPIYWELCCKENPAFTEEVYGNYNNFIGEIHRANNPKWVYNNLKYLINKYGYTNAEIAEKVKEFVYEKSFKDNKGIPIIHDDNWLGGKPELYGYYSAYDHVVLCWLFGKMIDLPKGFPWYTIDLQQMLDEKSAEHGWLKNEIKRSQYYPKKTNEHNALSDAIFNKELYNFIKSL